MRLFKRVAIARLRPTPPPTWCPPKQRRNV